MKKLSRVLALSLAFIMLIGTTTFAAVPNNSVTIGNRAISIDYIFNYLEDAKVLVNSLLDENPDSSIFFQLDGQNERFTDPFTGTEATEEDLAEVSVFIDENGEEQELEQKELEVVKVSAINGEVTVTLDQDVPAHGTPERVELLENLKLFVSINDAEAVEVESNSISFEGKQLVISVDEIVATEEEQSVVYSVQLGDAEAVEAKAFVIEAVEVGLKVESVSAINKSGVTVTFEALEEALEDVIVTVINPENEEVEVEALAIIEKGETSATFAFVKALEEDPTTGVWTVNGVEYDFDAVAAVAAVNEASNLVELWEALQSPYFTGAIEENIEAYQTALYEAEEAPATVEDVNKLIADVNKAVVENEAEQAVVDAVNEAANEFELLKALQNDAFTNVYTELIDNYNAVITNSEESIEAIQVKIDTVNVAADKEALTLGDISAVTEDLILPAEGKYGTTITWEAEADQEYLTDEGKVTRPSFVIEDQIVTLTATIAIGEEDAAITDTRVFNVTIKALEAAKSTYAFEFDEDELAALVAEEEATVNVTFKTVENLGLGYDAVRFAFVIEGPEGAEVTVSATDSEGNPYNPTIAADGEEKGYWGPAIGFEVEAEYDKTTLWTVNFSEAGEYTITFSLIDATSETEEVVDGITETVTVTVDKAYVVRVNEATTAEEMRTALTALALAEGIEDYINLSSQGKLEVAELVLADRADEEGEEFATKEDAKTALGDSSSGAIKNRADFISGVNSATEGISAMKTALDKDEFPEFQALSEIEKVDAAELVYNALNAFETGEQFETIAQIREAAGL